MTRKLLALSLLFSAFLLILSGPLMAAGSETEEGGEDPTGFIMHHIKDSHEWHFATIGHTHVTLPLPVIVYSSDRGLEFFKSSDFQNHETHVFGEEYAHEGYYIDSHDHVGRVDGASFIDFSITKNVVMMFLVIAIVLWLVLSAAAHYRRHGTAAPKGAASLVEPIVVFVRDEIAHKSIGPKYKKFVPYLLTLFFFIWVGNLLGLLPGAANLTGNIAVTATLAVLTFILVNINGNKDYWKHVFMTPGVPLPLLLVIVPVEIIGLFTKPFALMVRLFVAITAGHIVILAFIALIFIFQSYSIGVVSTLMVTFINMIELLVATIQAYVFTLFTAMYIGSAVAEHHDDH
ncbi:F0F1 ATP synthase subunit A [Algoriphagus lutimaris]|uniref:F0F1 ATP synthase subunit A n=1 Tax=Algoriphagus lutimaris TaxID=613197 RepID=UPI00196AAFBF|nr:F0F1 ATP synthase subunit A [Algoriphagus lutimaris]MBN3521530.1 F0F1 ATP synthase subunit A [Algoriphagus lutimaris]